MLEIRPMTALLTYLKYLAIEVDLFPINAWSEDSISRRAC
jgi:hypothetical protein